jgi:hypothetical protein
VFPAGAEGENGQDGSGKSGEGEPREMIARHGVKPGLLATELQVFCGDGMVRMRVPVDGGCLTTGAEQKSPAARGGAGRAEGKRVEGDAGGWWN